MIQEPAPPTVTRTPGPPRPPRSDRLWIGVVIGSFLAMAITFVIVIGVAQPPDTAIVAGASTPPAASAPSDRVQGKGHGPKANKGNNGNKGHKDDGAPGRGPITIRSIDGSALSLGTEDGWTRTITVTGQTVITKGGQMIAIGDLKVGDQIRFSQTRSADGSYTIDTIVVPTPTAGGVVTGKTSDSITIKHGDGSTIVIHVTPKTTYEYKGKDAATLADIAIGDRISAAGSLRADGSMDAVSVEGRGPKVQKPAKPAASTVPG